MHDDIIILLVDVRAGSKLSFAHAFAMGVTADVACIAVR